MNALTVRAGVLEKYMKIVSLVFPAFTLIDIAGPMQALSTLPGAEVQYVWKQRGLVPSDAGLMPLASAPADPLVAAAVAR
jgi:hypothetical protein